MSLADSSAQSESTVATTRKRPRNAARSFLSPSLTFQASIQTVNSSHLFSHKNSWGKSRATLRTRNARLQPTERSISLRPSWNPSTTTRKREAAMRQTRRWMTRPSLLLVLRTLMLFRWAWRSSKSRRRRDTALSSTELTATPLYSIKSSRRSVTI